MGADKKSETQDAPAEVKAEPQAEVVDPVALGGQQNFPVVTPEEAADHRKDVKDAHIAIANKMIRYTKQIEEDVKESNSPGAMTIRNRMQTIRRDFEDLLRSDKHFKVSE